MVLWRATVIFSLLLLLAAPVSAAPADVEVEAGLPLTTHGATQSDADGAVLVTSTAGTLELALEGDHTLVRHVQRSFGYVRPGDPDMEVLWNHASERHELEPGTPVTLHARHDGFQALAWDGHATATSDAVAVASTTEPIHVASEARRLGVSLRTDAAPAFTHTLPKGLLTTQSATGTTEMTGAFGLFLTGAVLTADGQQIQAHFRIEERPGTLYDPVSKRWIGGGSHEEYVHEYVLVEARDATLTLEHAGLPVRTYSRAAGLAVVGEALLPAAHGIVHVDVEDEAADHHELRGQDLSLAGDIALHVEAPKGQRVPVSGSGDLTQVSYGAVGASYDWATVATVTVGALVAAALGWLAKGFFGMAGYARVQGPKVLEHPGRQEVYHRVKTNPGIGFSQLVRQMDFGESTLQYHLRVLERNGFVARVKDGRYQRFFDRQSGLYSAGRKVAVSALRNDTTARIAGAILQEPGIAQRDLAARFGIAASTVNWHIQRLHNAGLVDRRRDHPHTRYYAGTAWATIPGQEHARLVSA